MIRNVVTLSILTILTGCATTGVARKPTPASPAVAKAFFSDQKCANDPTTGQAEIASAAILSWLIGKGAEAVVNYISNAVSEAAREDRETFTITGQNPDFLFAVQDGKARMRSCLYVVVAEPGKSGEWCDSNWYSTADCSPPPSAEVGAHWKQWGFGKPKLYAEIGMEFREGGPDTAFIPKIHKLYYPAPISTMPTDKVKGLTIAVSASKPSKSSKGDGDVVLEIFIGGDGITPLTAQKTEESKDIGLWSAVPSPEGKLGTAYANPVNLTVTVGETPNPTPWLQAIAKFIDANKQKAIDTIVENVDPTKREAAATAETISSLNFQVSAAENCTKLSTQIDVLRAQQIKTGASKAQPGEESLRLTYALDQACATTKLSVGVAQAAWQATGKDNALCNRGRDVEKEVEELCIQ